MSEGSEGSAGSRRSRARTRARDVSLPQTLQSLQPRGIGAVLADDNIRINLIVYVGLNAVARVNPGAVGAVYMGCGDRSV